ncbi:late competence development ComFB family protein [Anaerosalibacter massiliensis]|uniref:Late competence development ComFB family protein n=1 Tax=Anaerosalibacter massiliensis TaxID=1347392 RepID=A0A9X2S419_9FIRM|nr:late competence development ComFB family protein [Anaerosalibacter massiliensis]
MTYLIEDEVIYITNKVLKNKEDICTCEKCKLDIVAISLNNLPPQYVVTEKGELYKRVNNMNIQFEIDITREVIKSIEKVNKKPRHK